MPLYAILLAIPTLALAVSLVDFPPRVQNLPASCEAVYKAQILGCSPSDFKNNVGCSQGCISSLQNLVYFVQPACANAGITGNNPLAAFINGDGPHAICANAPSSQPKTTSTTSTSSPTTTEQPSTSQDQPTTSSTDAPTTSSSSPTSTSPLSAQSSAASSAVAKTTSKAAATSSTSAASRSSTSSSTVAASTTAPDGNRSGGGSPFDAVNRGSASALSVSFGGLLAAIGAAVVLL